MYINGENRLLQPSADRIDSQIGEYGPDNFQLVHLACNLAKNQFTTKEFTDWLTIASAATLDEEIERD
jgi:hypothetical protein